MKEKTPQTPLTHRASVSSVKALTERGGVLSPDDKALFDPANPRVALPSPVPVRCPAAREAKN